MRGQARELLAAATLADRSTVTALHELVEDAEPLADPVKDVLRQVDVGDVDHLIPVLSVASTALSEVQPFLDLLDHPDGTVRLLAAGACAERGEQRGLAVLAELLEDLHRDRSTRNPIPVWATATLTLARLTGEVIGPPLDADAYIRGRARERWQEVLKSREFTWSGERGEWD